ncbi:MAG TPA: hypothetical protein VLL97_00060, partial [Acidobacteriota bacterium]|nr:hypothetical protein [Acidobacteriota bacterium]
AVSIVQTVLMVAILQLRGPGEMSLTDMNTIVASSLGAMIEGFFGADVMPKFLMSLARAVDVFAIWIIALLAIGYSAVSTKLKASKAAVWLVAAYVVVVLIGAAIGGIAG